MTIVLGSDHSGFKLKQTTIDYLQHQGYSIKDYGAFSDAPSDYPDYVQKVCRRVLSDKDALGILICGTGIGTSIAANRFSGIRAAHCTNDYEARMSKKHNNANILCLGERVLGEKVALEIVDVWLQSTFSGEERHVRRLRKLETIAPLSESPKEDD